MAKLHVICGNCGSTDLKYERGDIDPDGGDLSRLSCDNCATLHFLQELPRNQHCELIAVEENE